MKNKFISNLSDVCLYIAVLMLCVASILTAINVKQLEDRINTLNAQIQELQTVNEEIKTNVKSVASDTDAKINALTIQYKEDNEKLNKDIDKIKKDIEIKVEPEVSKEVNDIVEEKAAYDEAVYMPEDSEPVYEPEVVDEPEPEPSVSEDNTSGMTYMGTWEISAYEYTGNACANGCMPTEWYTCAFNNAPLGATIYVEGLGYFVNEDVCGTPSRLDIYLGDVGACYEFGIQYHDVYIVN